jgi:hypothetical protein
MPEPVAATPWNSLRNSLIADEKRCGGAYKNAIHDFPFTF